MQWHQDKVHNPDTNAEVVKPTYKAAADDNATATHIPAWANGDTLPAGLQAKLTINQPGDVYEQEADRVAEQVMQMPIAGPSEVPESKTLMRKASGANPGTPDAPPIVQQALRSGAEPLDASAQETMETRFDQDFSHVRVHADGQAAESARAIHARAYTVGSDVVFAEGQYKPETGEGQRLLAHELTHVVQQNGAGNLNQAVQKESMLSMPGTSIQRQSDNSPDASVPPTATTAPPSAAELDQQYQDALQLARQTGDWRNTAELLNGFNREDIQRRLAQLSLDETGYLHQGALDNPRVGPQSQVALLTEPGTPLASTAPAPASMMSPAPIAQAQPASNFQNQLAQNPAMAQAYKPIYGRTGTLIGYSRSSNGYFEVRNTDGEIVYSDELPLEHGLPIIDPALDLVEKGLKQLGYAVVGTLDTVLEDNWRALGLPVDEDHKQPIAQRLGIPTDATAYTIGRGAGHLLSLLETAAAYVGGATLFISGAGELVAGVATTPAGGTGLVVIGVGAVSVAAGTTVVIYGGALGKATFMNMMSQEGGSEPSGENGPYKDIKDNTKIAPGRDFQPGQKPKIIEANKAKNGGKIISDDPLDPYQELSDPQQAQGGSPLDPAMAEIDHIVPKSAGGTNSYGNARVISKYWNNFLRAKGVSQVTK